MTREHVVPNWLRNIIPRVSENHTHVATLYIKKNESKPTFQRFVKTRGGNLGTRQLLMVCEICNTGWMKDLQDELIPILSPLINGDWTKFSAQHAERISVWLAMTTSVVAMSFPKSGGVTVNDRNFYT
ncbi:hypothetical protein ACFSTD_15140 [Novosphingobium colocasiae]